MKRYLGLDQSLTSTGVAVVSPGNNQPLELTNIDPGGRRDGERLAFIRRAVGAFLDAHTPVLAAIEGYAYGAGAGRFFELGEVGGVLKCLLFERGIPYVTVAPVQLKKFVAKNTGADKDDMRAATKTKWGVDINQNDQCDAYGLARVAMVYAGNSSSFREELEVVKALRTPTATTTLKPRRGAVRRSL